MLIFYIYLYTKIKNKGTNQNKQISINFKKRNPLLNLVSTQ